MDPQMVKYWVMRYELFSKYDEGIQLDHESWYSVTPEEIASHIAHRCSRIPDAVILDAFCGCGGNTIQFAKRMKRVIAIDIDPVKVEYAKNNARIYGVEDKIEFLVGDSLKLIPTLKADVIFLSPPWGGPEYVAAPIYDLSMIPVDGFEIFKLAQKVTANIAYYLPRNANLEQVMKLAGENNLVEIENHMFKGKTKARTAYYGNLISKKLKKQFLEKKARERGCVSNLQK